MAYKIIDKDNGGYFADGAIFATRAMVRNQLISYHNSDSLEDLTGMDLNSILEYGNWDIQEVENG